MIIFGRGKISWYLSESTQKQRVGYVAEYIRIGYSARQCLPTYRSGQIVCGECFLAGIYCFEIISALLELRYTPRVLFSLVLGLCPFGIGGRCFVGVQNWTEFPSWGSRGFLTPLQGVWGTASPSGGSGGKAPCP